MHVPLNVAYQTAYKFAGVRPAEAWGLPQATVLLNDLKSGKTIATMYPCRMPRDSNDARDNPALRGDPNVVNLLRTLKPGDIVTIKATEIAGRHALTFIEPFKPKVGEEEPGTCVFKAKTSETIGGKSVSAITVGKLFVGMNLVLPHTRLADGNLAPDPEVTAAVAKLRDGDVIFVQCEVVADKVVLRDLQPYYPATAGRWVKYETTKVSGKPRTTVVIKTGLSEETFAIPTVRSASGAEAPDKDLIAAAAKLRPGQAVDYRVRKDADGTWIWFLQPSKGAGKSAANVK